MKYFTLICVCLLIANAKVFGQATEGNQQQANFFFEQFLRPQETLSEKKQRFAIAPTLKHSPGIEEQIERYQQFKTRNGSFIALRNSTTNTVWVPVQFHIAKNTAGYGAMSPYTLSYYFNQINTILADANVQLYQCGAINYIVDNNIYTLPRGNRSILNVHDVAGVMNIYFVDQYSNYCGEADYPGNGERIIYATDCFGFDPVTVLTHLIGQFFSLYPTHGTSSTAPELVDGSNCTTAGDEICDTPADPNLFTSGYNSSTCEYTGTLQDANNQYYQPDATNYMSYAAWSCRDHFTPQQLARLYNGAVVDRANLTGCNAVASCGNPIDQFPYQEGFENGWNGWEQTDIDYYDFSINSGSTPTQGTGPTTAAEGNSYIYSEATNNFGGTAIHSPCFDLTNIAQPSLSFQYHMYGQDINFLGIQVSLDGGFWWFGTNANNLIDEINGDQGNSWQTRTVDLSAYANEPSFRFRFVALLNSGGDLQDIAIDDIQISDAACFAVSVASTNPSCHNTADGTASIIINGSANSTDIEWSTGDINVTGIQNLAAGNYSVTVSDNNCTVVENFTITAPDSLYVHLLSQEVTASGSTDGVIESVVYGGSFPYTYAWSDNNVTDSYRLGIPSGNYIVTVTDANNCSALADVFVDVNTACSGTISNWPYHLDFETGTRLFKQSREDNRNWKKRSGPTPTSATGPNQAAEGTYYRYIESSGRSGHPNKTAVLTTKKCLDLSSLNNPVLTFKYHMQGTNTGSLSVQVNENNGGWKSSIWQKTGEQSNVWQQALIDLSSYQNSSLRIRIVGVTGNGPRSDIAIDDLWIKSANTNLFIPEKTTLEKAPVQTAEVSFTTLIYPNPVSDILNVFFENRGEETRQITIKDSYGRRIKSLQSVDQSLSIDLSELPIGIYFLSIQSKNKLTETKKIVVSR